MLEFGKTDPEYLAYAHSLNIRNIGKFSLAGATICLLLLTDRSGPTPGVVYNHIFNSDVLGVFFFVYFMVNWLLLKLWSNNILVQKIACWGVVIGTYLFSGLLGYINTFTSSGLTSIAVAYLMIAFLFAEHLVRQIFLLIANAVLFYLFTVYIGGVDKISIWITLVSVVFLSILVLTTMDKQRKEVFYSQKKIAEQVKELNNALDVKASFFGHMSHELRTPLNAIIGFSDMLKTMAGKGMDSQKIEEYAGFINSGGNHLLSLVNDLLDQNKLETGKIDISAETLDVEELLNKYVDELAPISDNKNQSVEIKKSSEQIYIQSDRRIFKQIIYNLLSNALKYTPEHGRIEIIPHKGQKDFIEIEINDNGRGMPEEVVEQIRNNSAPVKSHFISHAEGMGLGLIIVRQLLYRLGATIDVESQLDKGTRIRLTFPEKFPAKND